MPSRPVPPAEKPTLESLATGLERAYREIWKLRDEKMEMAFEIQELKRKVATRESACKAMQTIAKRKSAELQARDREEKTKKLATEKAVAKPSSAPGLSGKSLACSSRKAS